MKAANLIASVVFTTIQASAADITFAAQKMSYTGMGEPVDLTKLISYKKTAYAAGTKQVATIAFAAVTIVEGSTYNVTLYRKDTGEQVTYACIAGAGETTTTLAEQFKLRIANDLAAFVTATRSGTTLTVTESALTTQGVLISAPTGAVVVVTVAHVSASGTVAEVKEYNSAVTSGTFRKYEFVVNREVNIGGTKQLSEAVIIVWADEGATNFAAFDTRHDGTSNGEGILTGDYLDNTSAATLAASAEKYVEKVG